MVASEEYEGDYDIDVGGVCDDQGGAMIKSWSRLENKMVRSESPHDSGIMYCKLVTKEVPVTV